MDAKELEALFLLPPIVHDQLLGLTDIEGEVAMFVTRGSRDADENRTSPSVVSGVCVCCSQS